MPEIIDSRGLTDEQDLCDGIRDEAINFFRHATIERPQPGLDMCNRDPQLHSSQGASHR
jgi:hypothetical protein